MKQTTTRVGPSATQRGANTGRRSVPRARPEPTLSLVFFGLEVGGRRAEEAATFLRVLAQARAASAPAVVRSSSAQAARVLRWSGLIFAAVQFVPAATRLDLPPLGACCRWPAPSDARAPGGPGVYPKLPEALCPASIKNPDFRAPTTIAPRIESNGLPIWHEFQLALDAIIVFTLSRLGAAHPSADVEPGGAVIVASRRARHQNLYSELARARRYRFSGHGPVAAGRQVRKQEHYQSHRSKIPKCATPCQATMVAACMQNIDPRAAWRDAPPHRCRAWLCSHRGSAI